LTSNITIRESGRVNLEIGLAGVVVQIADGAEVDGSVLEVERVKRGSESVKHSSGLSETSVVESS